MGMEEERLDVSENGDQTATSGLPVIDSVTDYEKIQRIGEGTFGVVYKARHCDTGEIVALKKVRMERERDGVPVTSIRELRVLQSCRHPNIVELKRVVTGSKLDSMFLVFEYCDHDLGKLLDSMPYPFSESEVKCLLIQLLDALCFLHDRWVVHRDLKMSNLLLTHNGVLKLCDFGLARYFKPYDMQYTPRVITLWYRAPEVLLGSDSYTESVDCWSVGAIMAELLRHQPLFPAKNEVEMISMVAQLLGAPNDTIWPGFSRLPQAKSIRFPDQPYNCLKKEFPHLSESGIDLLNKLLMYDPEKRITARQARKHPYFSEPPLPKSPEHMPAFATCLDGGQQSRGRKRGRQEVEDVDAEARRRRYAVNDEAFGEAFGESRLGHGRKRAPGHP